MDQENILPILKLTTNVKMLDVMFILRLIFLSSIGILERFFLFYVYYYHIFYILLINCSYYAAFRVLQKIRFNPLSYIFIETTAVQVKVFFRYRNFIKNKYFISIIIQFYTILYLLSPATEDVN